MGRPYSQRVVYTPGSVIMGTTVMDVNRGVPLDAEHKGLEPNLWLALDGKWIFRRGKPSPRLLHVILSFSSDDPFRSRSESVILSLLHISQDEHARCLYRYSSAVAQNAGPLPTTLSGAWPKTSTRIVEHSRYVLSPNARSHIIADRAILFRI